jgi:WD40 repeat protein/transcriptional regulator with XRE-family HTH domain
LGNGFVMDSTSDRVGEQARHTVGAELRRLREEQGLSLSALARKVHYSTGYLSKIETGKKRLIPELARLVDEALGTGGALAALLASESSPPTDDAPDLTGTDVCPYPGLAAFGPQEARWFFGRDRAISDLISQLDDRLAGGGLLAVIAPSGAGKSSLLAAGLIPALASGGLPGSRAWPVVTITPGAGPLATLAAGVAARTGADPADAAAAAGDADRFAAFLAEAVAAYTGKQGETSSSARVVLIVDQFEEVFTECRHEAERQAFITALCTAAQSAVALVVLGVRADFYGPCLAYPALLTALQSPVALGPMSADQLRAVITRPAQAEGLKLEPGLVELLLRDLGVAEDAGAGAAGSDPGALPLLAHTLRMTWQQRDGQMLTVAGYRRTGGIRQALATTAERAYSRLSPAEQQIARQILLRLVNVSDQGGSGDTRRRLPRARLIEALPPPGSADAVETVLELFGRARLLTFDITSVEITHEALLRAWPRLRQWIDTDRAGNLIRQELEEAAAVWDRDRRDTAGLYRGSRLEAARTWATSTSNEEGLSPATSAFLAVSIQQEHRAAQLRRAVLVVLSVLALVASVAAVVALQQSATAQRERDTAIFNQITAQADRLRSSDVSLAAQLDLTAYRMRASPDLATALITAGNDALSTPLAGHTNGVLAVAFSPDGRTLVTGSVDKTVRLWNVTDPARPILLGPPLTDHTAAVYAVAFSPDGHTLVTGSVDKTVRLWNVTDPARPILLGPPLTDHTDGVLAVAFSPDGRTLATGSADKTVRLWNVTDPAHPTLLGQPLIVHTGPVYAVAFSPDRHTLATGSTDHTARLWNVTNPAHPSPLGTPLAGHTNAVMAVAFSPNGHIVATGSTDHTARLWNVTNRAQPMPLGPPLSGHTNWVYAVAFSPDGHTLATGSTDGTARLWNIPSEVITGHTNTVLAVAFSPDGRTLATSSADKSLRLWNVTDPARPTPLGPPLAAHTDYVYAVAFSPDGHTLATGSYDQTVRLWNVADPAHPTPLGPPLIGHTAAVYAVAFSPDGHTLATGSYDQTVRLWNVADPARLTPLGQPLILHTNWVYAVAFSPDGHTLATGSADRTVRLWGMNVDRAIQRICATTTNTLTSAKWAQYVSPDRPYQPPCP